MDRKEAPLLSELVSDNYLALQITYNYLTYIHTHAWKTLLNLVQYIQTKHAFTFSSYEEKKTQNKNT